MEIKHKLKVARKAYALTIKDKLVLAFEQRRRAHFHACSRSVRPPPTLGGVSSNKSRSTAATRSSIA